MKILERRGELHQPTRDMIKGTKGGAENESSSNDFLPPI
jgi:hypothetical protein